MAARRLNSAGETRSRLPRRILWLALALLVLDQVTLRVLVQSDRIFGFALIPYYPPEFGGGEANPHPPLTTDETLGWRLASEQEGGTIEADWSGGRLGLHPLAQRKRPDVQRILLLGGSITLAAGLANEETFAARLDAASDSLEMVNLATPLYGIDQSLLRLQKEGDSLQPDEVWLAFEPHHALVATTRYLPLVQREASEPLFKPRFALSAEGELTQLATPEDAATLLDTRERYLEFASTEMWASRRGSFAIPGLGGEFFVTKFAASLSLARGLERDSRLACTGSEAFQTLAALVLALEHEATLAGARLRVLILPDKSAARRNAERALPEHRLFADELRSYGLEVHEFELPLQPGPGAGGWSAADHQRVANSLALLLAQEP